MCREQDNKYFRNLYIMIVSFSQKVASLTSLTTYRYIHDVRDVHCTGGVLQFCCMYVVWMCVCVFLR